LLDGTRVAVKVLRPGVERQVAQDSAALRLAADLAERLVPAARRLRPREFVEVVIRALDLELDLRFEAAGCAELGEAMKLDPYMRAPQVVWDGVGKRFLTLTWASGLALSDPAALEQPGLDRKALAEAVTRGFLAQALDHGLFHADLHEGNLFVSAPVQGGGAAIVAVDYGILGRLGPAERKYLAEILYGFLNRDYPRVAAVHFDAGYVPAHQDRDAFAQALRAVGEPVFGRDASDVSMGRLLAQLFEITALFDMALRPELVLLQKTMVTVEGVARRIDPTHDLWAAADPVVRRWIARELSPAAKVRDFADEAVRAIRALARLAEAPAVPAVAVVEPRPARPLLWFLAGAAVAGLAFAAGALAGLGAGAGGANSPARSTTPPRTLCRHAVRRLHPAPSQRCASGPSLSPPGEGLGGRSGLHQAHPGALRTAPGSRSPSGRPGDEAGRRRTAPCPRLGASPKARCGLALAVAGRPIPTCWRATPWFAGSDPPSASPNRSRRRRA
jgi:ubiquinone biosynthesis protein